MKFVHVLVEGQTENEFVNDILNEYLQAKNVTLTSIIAKTKRPIGGNPAYRGGIVSYGKIEFDIRRFLNDTSVSLVTTMIDFYRLPTDFPGYKDKEASTGTIANRVKYLEDKFAENIDHQKFFPYFSVHEFEALLFTEPARIVSEVAGEDDALIQNLKSVRDSYPTPEDINLENPPSKRILSVMGSYDKVAHGYGIAIDIGVDAIRKECLHFNHWLTKIENLATE